jgi:eukaryotic-like serine/threonine-protein kinase
MPSHFVPGLPSSFDAWFMRAMEREPDRRFSSVSELADGLGAAAGMAPRSQVASSHGGQNIGQMATAAVGSVPQGAITPQGLGPPHMVQTPPPQPTPFGNSGSQGGYPQGGQQGYGTGGGYQQAGSQTPHPAGMTNSPFTSSQPVQGVGGGKGKWIFGIVGVLAVAAGVAVALKLGGLKPKDDSATDGARLTPPPAASSVATPAPPASEKPAEPANPQGAASIAVAPPPPSAQPTQKVTSTKVGPTKTPTQPKVTPTPATPTVVTTPTTTPTPTPTPVKKPPKNPNDPGY